MIRRHLVPSICVLLGGMTSLYAATAEERDVHFRTIQDLIDAGMRLPAERGIEAFRNAGYPNAEWYVKGLRFAYTDYFRTASHADIAVPLEQEYNALRSELQGAVANLPDKVRLLVEGAGDADLRRFVNIILRDMNPDAPPPLVPFTEERQREFEARLRRLLTATEQTLTQLMADITAFEPEVERSWDLDPESREYTEIFQKAVLLRYEYAHAFYTAYKALREVVIRGEQFGLSASVRRDVVEPWLHGKLKENIERFGEWEWHYAEVYPLLKHRMATIMAEAIRLNELRQDLGTIGNLSYDDVRRSFFDVIDLDLSQFPREFRDGLTQLKYETWSDLFFWHLAMGTQRALDEAERMWQDFLDRGPDPLNTRDRSRQQAVGHLYLLAGRIFEARGETSRANALWVEVQQSGNFFAGNAPLWITWAANRDSAGGSGWASMPTAEDPGLALTLSRELMRTARNETDREVRQRLMQDAQVSLRNGILGLPSSSDPDFISLAPELYRSYAFALHQSGLLYEATIVVEEALNRFRALWEQRDNPWQRAGELTQAGQMVQTISNDFLSYSQMLRSRAPHAAARDAYGRAIAALRIFNPERAADGLDWNEFIVSMQQGDMLAAEEALKRYEQNNPNERLRILGAWARLRYAAFNQLRSADAPAAQLNEAQRRMEATIDEVRAAIEPMIRGDEATPEGQERQVQDLWRFLTTVQVATQFQAGQNQEVLDRLGPEFWETLQDDRDLNRQLFNFLSGAAYRLAVEIVRDPARSQDPALMLEMWPHYTNTVEVYEKLVARWPELQERMLGNRRQIAALFNMTRQQTDFFQQNVVAGTDGYEDYDPEIFQGMSQDAQGFFARIFPIDKDTEPRVVLSVAMAHWRLGNRDAAVPLFERYKELLDGDPTLQAFRRDPTALINQFRQRMAARQALRPYWERRGEKSIPDLLIDEPGLIDEILDARKSESDWSEKKRDFAAALSLTNEFGEALQSQRALIPDFDAVWKEFEEFRDLVQGLAFSVQIDTMLVEAYREMGRGAEAVALANALRDYDPLNPTFMSLIVEGTLEQLQAGDEIAPADIRRAQEIAARLRNLTATSQRRDLYWTAVCQVVEFAVYMGDADTANRILRRHVVDNNLPIGDFAVPLSDPPRAVSAQGYALSERFLALFSLTGITVPPPYRIEERDGDIIFIRENR